VIKSRFGYPPDLLEEAAKTVQARTELVCADREEQDADESESDIASTTCVTVLGHCMLNIMITNAIKEVSLFRQLC
jgi:hypothetical protein